MNATQLSFLLCAVDISSAYYMYLCICESNLKGMLHVDVLSYPLSFISVNLVMLFNPSTSKPAETGQT